MPEPQRRRGTRGRQAEKYCERELPPDASGESSQASYSARGKAPYTGQGVTEGRSLHRQLAPDPVGPEARTPTALQGIADNATANTQPRLRDRYGCLDVELLWDGWGELNKDAARGVDGVTGQG